MALAITGLSTVTTLLAFTGIVVSVTSLNTVNPFEAMSRIDRNITTIIKGDLAFTIEVLQKTGLFSSKYINHTHSISEVNPAIKKPDALFYFKLNDAPYFETPLMKWYDIHTHKGIYYINKFNHNIYSYDDDKAYSKVEIRGTHTHYINVTVTQIKEPKTSSKR